MRQLLPVSGLGHVGSESGRLSAHEEREQSFPREGEEVPPRKAFLPWEGGQPDKLSGGGLASLTSVYGFQIGMRRLGPGTAWAQRGCKRSQCLVARSMGRRLRTSRNLVIPMVLHQCPILETSSHPPVDHFLVASSMVF